MKIFKTLCLIAAVMLLVVSLSGLYVSIKLPDVGPAPKLTLPRDSASLKRGAYLANHVTVCMDCHSKRDWTIFSGPVAKGTFGSGGEKFSREQGFPGEIYSSNLTPAGLKGWSDGEIYRAITSGVSRDGHALFPLMGYQRFAKMDKKDILAIIAYIRTLPAVNTPLGKTELDFPVSVLNNLAPGPADHQPLPPTTDTVRYGGYLVNAAGCIDCHSKQDKGKIIDGSEYAGGMEFPQQAGVIRAPNITSDLKTGIGSWSRETFVSRFASYRDPALSGRKLGATELNSPMPWTMYGAMTDSDLSAIYAYLRSVKKKSSNIKVRSYRK